MPITLHHKYKNLVEHTGKYFLATGGRGSGKSFSIAVYLILLSFETGHKILFTRLTMVSAHISIIPEMVGVIQAMGLADQFDILKTKIINKQSGSEILFMGLRHSRGDNTARLKSIAGITTWVLDEAEELVDESLFDKVNLSIRKSDSQNRVILILNPTTKNHWIYSKFFLSKSVKAGFNGIVGDTCYIHTTYLDNKKNLSDEFINDVQALKLTNPEKYKHIVQGAWLEKAEGVIFSNYEFGTFPKDVELVFGADWGYSIDPSTLVAVHIDELNKRIYVKQHLYQRGLNTNQLSEIFKKVCGNSLVVGDSAEARLIDEMKLNGVNIIPVKKGAGSINEGVMLMKNYQIIIDYRSKDIMKEFNNYSWAENGEKPIDKFNHLIDSIRYVVLNELRNRNSEWIIL
ncbi:PBSX family phage terminase large subunit [Flavobacterium chungangensis]|uniref:PBSX family phage terminase large subunit n=1 Tax=Flavobacterium chungangensis TaxID=2708132 RepID=A0ABV8ZCC6_9FLAO